jgi:hypothetical protein
MVVLSMSEGVGAIANLVMDPEQAVVGAGALDGRLARGLARAPRLRPTVSKECPLA